MKVFDLTKGDTPEEILRYLQNQITINRLKSQCLNATLTGNIEGEVNG